MNTDKRTIEKFRKELPTLRCIAGWSAEHLATLLGVSRVTVVNIENTQNKMTIIQYLAVRMLLQEEIRNSKNETLEYALDILVDRENVGEKIKQEMRNRVSQAAKRVGRKAGQTAISKEANITIGEMRLNDIPDVVKKRGEEAIAELVNKTNHTQKEE